MAGLMIPSKLYGGEQVVRWTTVDSISRGEIKLFYIIVNGIVDSINQIWDLSNELWVTYIL